MFFPPAQVLRPLQGRSRLDQNPGLLPLQRHGAGLLQRQDLLQGEDGRAVGTPPAPLTRV